MFIQLALQLKDPKDKYKLLNKIDRAVAGLHHATDGKYIYKTNTDTPLYKLPDDPQNLSQLCKIMSSKFSRPLDQALASLGANKDTIVLNINHAASDGMYIQHLFEYLKKDDEIDYVPTILPADTIFEKQIREYNGPIPDFFTVDPNLTRAYPSRQNELHISGYILTNGADTNAKNFMTYKRNGKLKSLTDYYWTNFIIATSAFNDKFDNCGVATCIDLRQFLLKYDFNIANCFSHISVAAHATKDDTVEELMKRMRADFNLKVKQGTHIGELKALQMGNNSKPLLPGVGIDISLIGSMKVEGPFNDVWVQPNLLDHGFAGVVTYFGFSVEKDGENIIHGRFRHSSSTCSDKEAEILVNSLHYGIENVFPSMKIGEAIDMMKDYQFNLKRKMPNDVMYLKDCK